MDRLALSQFIKQEAYKLGFMYCGIAKATYLEEEAPRLESWLKKGYHGKMAYMENHFDKRLDPTKLVPGAKSVISLAYNYCPEEDLTQEDNYKVSKYAYGTDYHFVIKDKLKALVKNLEGELGEIHGRVFVDSAPVMERAWAKKSGIGWVGKHSLLLNRQQGSFFFLAELISDLAPEEDGPTPDYCGTCTRCIDACPTDAIVDNQVVDASKCISYLTIELKEEVPEEFQGKMDNWIFGCDICQDVCPWNRFAQAHSEPKFKPFDELKDFTKMEWEEMTSEVFNKVFKNSPMKRPKWKGIKRNIDFIKKISPEGSGDHMNYSAS